MRPKTVYLLLAVLGAVVPYRYFAPWVLAHGLDLPLLVREQHANPISAFFGAGIFMSAAVVLAYLFFLWESLPEESTCR